MINFVTRSLVLCVCFVDRCLFLVGFVYPIFSFMCMFCRSLFVFSGVRVTRSLVLYVCFVDRCLFLVGFVYPIFSFMCMFCRSLFVLLCFFFWSLCCLFFFNLRILITLWYLQTLLTYQTGLIYYVSRSCLHDTPVKQSLVLCDLHSPFDMH